MMDGEVDVVFLIADLAGYTALTEAHGGPEAAKVVHRYVELAERTLRPGLSIVERVGDQVLIVGEHAPAMVETAIALRDAVDAEEMFPGVRMGIHGGRVLQNAGRYYGAALNLTARLAAHAQPGQIVCSASIAGACEGHAGVTCRGLGAVRFKNVPMPIDVFEIVASHAADATAAVDPVCLMHVSERTAAARVTYRDAVYLFCSFDCARAFTSTPEQYA